MFNIDTIKYYFKTCILPLSASLFLIPLFWNPTFINSFTQGKELMFQGIIFTLLIFIFLNLYKKKELKIKNLYYSNLFKILLSFFVIALITNLMSPTSMTSFIGSSSRGF